MITLERFAVRRDDWIEKENSTQASTDDYLDADMILYKFEYLVESDFESPISWALWDLVYEMLGTLGPNIQSILPDEAPIVERILKQFGNEFRLTTAKTSTPNHQRPVDWLEKNGFCLDHLEARESAGKVFGAFATQPLETASIVAPVPVVQIHRNNLQMTWKDRMSTMWKGRQLVLNYCLGHKSSSVLLFPYSPVVNYLNHGKPSNVALRWSERMPHPERLNHTAAEIHADKNGGLLLELYALKQISPAWVAHQAQWTPPLYTEHYRSAESYYEVLAVDPNQDFRKLDASVDVFIRNSFKAGKYVPSPNAELFPCTIVAADSVEPIEESSTCNVTEQTQWDSETFSVQWIQKRAPESSRFSRSSELLGMNVSRVPLIALEFRDRKYTTNLHLRSAFRHEIGLPDNLFPDSWKDMKSSKKPRREKTHSSIADAMNDRVDWVRIPEEIEENPYPPMIYTVCLVDYESIRIDSSAVPGREFILWTIRANMFPAEYICEILCRHHETTEEEVRARVDSTLPLPLHCNATVSFPEYKLNFTGIPRSAIRFRQHRK
eukprot:scaffold2363_cov159-Amphora_coffeaeformis.AAC.43